ncbi:hypothetical protein HIM_09497 [Hirsutella minnesotensis 3608]|uniref:Rhodopsin domain-containing protein n=1 Tax=Hirsutella minnesotensis 3608 TaxID=1043627 RepID=A0A0F7ZSC9_9HYPO|nr:hypothetical protein HIM_09497 [Hirsutella minnesotensis 3608]
MNIFQCRPIRAAWTSHLHEEMHATCISLFVEFICAAPVNIITDIALLILPIPILSGMHLPSRQKGALILAFMLAIFVTIVGVFRIVSLQYTLRDTPIEPLSNAHVPFGSQQNFSRHASLSLMWSAVEVNVSIACACIPTLKPLIVKIFPRVLFDERRSGSSEGSSEPKATLFRSWTGKATAILTLHVKTTRSDNSASSSATRSPTTPGIVQPGNISQCTNSDSATRVGTYDSMSWGERAESEAGTYFGFVHMTKPPSMTEANAAKSFKYCTIVSVLFFLWGLSWGLLHTINDAIAVANNITMAKALGLSAAYFGGGYFFGPLFAGLLIMRKDRNNSHESDGIGGYKATFIVGLCIYGIGAMMFWPSAETRSYAGFILSNFVVGFGLSILEVGANSFLILCGPPKYGETRLLIAQGVQGIGSIVNGLMSKAIFSRLDISNRATFIKVQLIYLGIALLSAILGIFFHYVPLPEVSDAKLEEESANHPHIDPKKRSIGGLQLRTISLILAVFAQYMYVATQESNDFFFHPLLDSVSLGNTKSNSEDAVVSDKPPGLSLRIPEYLLVGHVAWTVSRLLFGFLTYLSASNLRLPRPRAYLTISVAVCFILAILNVVLRPTDPDVTAVLMTVMLFAEAPIWPLIFAIGLRGQGQRTKRAAAFITMGASGAAVVPFIMYGIITTGGTVQNSFIVVVVVLVATMVYPAFLRLSGAARRLVDPVHHELRAVRDMTAASKWHGHERDEKEGTRQLLPDISKMKKTTSHLAP